MKSAMSLEMYEKLILKDLNTTGIPHVVGASGESQHKWENILPDIHSMQIPKKTHNSR